MAVETDERAVTYRTLAGLAQAYKFALSGGGQTLEKRDRELPRSLCVRWLNLSIV